LESSAKAIAGTASKNAIAMWRLVALATAVALECIFMDGRYARTAGRSVRWRT
jgi:hypothetical protein